MKNKKVEILEVAKMIDQMITRIEQKRKQMRHDSPEKYALACEISVLLQLKIKLLDLV